MQPLNSSNKYAETKVFFYWKIEKKLLKRLYIWNYESIRIASWKLLWKFSEAIKYNNGNKKEHFRIYEGSAIPLLFKRKLIVEAL